jgi:hypothetical protein
MGAVEEETVRPSVVDTGKGPLSTTVVGRGGLGGVDVEAKANQAEAIVGGAGASRDVDRQQGSESISPGSAGEYERVKAFYEKNGYLSAPRQSKEATLRRLQAM